jgi:hypothetical protein
MMGGLAYMTGRPGDPLRAGTSVNDIMGGMFGAIGALGALIQRGITGKGMEVQSALFENNVFLVGQHMLQYAVTGLAPQPMPARISPWGVYDVFTVADGEQIFLAAVSDAQWQVFCDVLDLPDLKADPRLATNNQRVAQRESLLRTLRDRLAGHSAADRQNALRQALGRTRRPHRGGRHRRALHRPPPGARGDQPAGLRRAAPGRAQGLAHQLDRRHRRPQHAHHRLGRRLRRHPPTPSASCRSPRWTPTSRPSARRRTSRSWTSARASCTSSAPRTAPRCPA